jgi:hypothetical protein
MGHSRYLPVWGSGSFIGGCCAGGVAGGSESRRRHNWKAASFSGGSTITMAAFCGAAVGVEKWVSRLRLVTDSPQLGGLKLSLATPEMNLEG